MSSAQLLGCRWKATQLAGTNNEIYNGLTLTSGFASISRRRSNKTIIAAVNGDAFGGAVEIILNCDLVVASEKTKLGLPEVHVGVIVGSGGIQRLLRISGHQARLLFVNGTSLGLNCIFTACFRTIIHGQIHIGDRSS